MFEFKSCKPGNLALTRGLDMRTDESEAVKGARLYTQLVRIYLIFLLRYLPIFFLRLSTSLTICIDQH